LVEDVFVERRRGNGEVLHDARQVAEPDVHELHLLVGDEANDLFWGVEHARLLLRVLRIRAASAVLSVRERHASRAVLPSRHPNVSPVLTHRPVTHRWYEGGEKPPWQLRPRHRCAP